MREGVFFSSPFPSSPAPAVTPPCALLEDDLGRVSQSDLLSRSYYKKLRVQPLFFFLLLLSFSSLFLFLLSFSFVTMIRELLGLKKRAF